LVEMIESFWRFGQWIFESPIMQFCFVSDGNFWLSSWHFLKLPRHPFQESEATFLCNLAENFCNLAGWFIRLVPPSFLRFFLRD
jgi:hypothetical protein